MPAAAQQRMYVVLRKQEVTGLNGPVWAEHARVEAYGARDAMNKTVTEPGTYAAVTARNWTEIPLVLQTRLVAAFDGAPEIESEPIEA